MLLFCENYSSLALSPTLVLASSLVMLFKGQAQGPELNNAVSVVLSISFSDNETRFVGCSRFDFYTSAALTKILECFSLIAESFICIR